jgi:membrane-bound metal-dependent hydrolase YbcI (DUF457 family)
MPTPIGHSLAGLAIHFVARRFNPGIGWRVALLVVLLANLPDIDFLPGYLMGDPRGYHWGPTHSLFAAMMVGLAVGVMTRGNGITSRSFALLAATAYASHLLLDLSLGPGAPSLGLQIFWPFSETRRMLPWAIFRMAPDSIETVGPVGTLFSLEILPVVVREIMLLAPLLGAMWIFSRRTPRSAF